MADSPRFSIRIRAHNSHSHISPVLIFLISSGYNIHGELQKLVCAQISAKLRRAHSSLSSDTIIGQFEDVARPRKLNFHSVSRRRWWTAKRDHVAVTGKTKRLYYARRAMEIENGEGGDWQGCRVFPLASNGKDDYLISAELGLLPLKLVILLSFHYNRLKCIHPLIMRRRLILYVALLWA